MNQTERICPNCGASNSYDRARCARCGTNLTTLPARQAPRLPTRWTGPGTTALVAGALAFAGRTGLWLVRNHVLPRVAKSITRPPTAKAKAEPSNKPEPVREEEPDYTIRGWRVWSYRRGDDQASGSEQFEWKIKRTRGR